jgi:hypothetical protein
MTWLRPVGFRALVEIQRSAGTAVPGRERAVPDLAAPAAGLAALQSDRLCAEFGQPYPLRMLLIWLCAVLSADCGVAEPDNAA